MQQSSTVTELDNLAALCSSLHLQGDAGDIAGRLLEPIASSLGAESAACRRVRLQPGKPEFLNLVNIGVAESVSEDYLGFYYRFDPILGRLGDLARNMPAMADAAQNRMNSQIPDHHVNDTGDATYPDADGFNRYYRHFLVPNGLVHHRGFLLVDRNGQCAWVFNFHRRASSHDFNDLETARARLIEVHLRGQVAGHDNVSRNPSWLASTAMGKLTLREREIALAVSRGLANKQIAASMDISPRTVENHLRNIYAKLKINTRTRLGHLLHHHDDYSADDEGGE